jgi:enolase
MKITKVVGREIFDSRGMPTLECEITLDTQVRVCASVPSGVCQSAFEAMELRDGGQRLMGKGVAKAVDALENIIAPLIIGQDPDLITMDLQLLELDGTDDKSNLGTNTMLAASMAICRAQAVVHSMETYELIAHICGVESVSMPFPLFNLINGGQHAHNGLTIQEFMIMPVGAKSFRESVEHAVTIFHNLKKLLAHHGKSIAVGDEGGFAPDFADDIEALDFLMEAIETSGIEEYESVVLALDVAASHMYDQKTKLYTWQEQTLTSQELVGVYKQLAQTYPIYSLEDGLSEYDAEGWPLLMTQFGDSLQIVGDNLFATNPHRIMTGAQYLLANAVVIKPNQIGTVTETLQAIKVCKEHDLNTIVSHRSGETNDTFIVDLAVGTNAGQIKAGGCSRGERLAKYNQLMRIEDTLMYEMMGV